MILRDEHSEQSLDSERDRNNVFTEITVWLTAIVLCLGSFYKKERQAARPFIFPTEGLAITFYLSPLPQIDYTRARRREGTTITEGRRKSFQEFSSTWSRIISNAAAVANLLSNFVRTIVFVKTKREIHRVFLIFLR